MRVVGMSRDEVYQLPPVDRENIIKLVRMILSMWRLHANK